MHDLLEHRKVEAPSRHGSKGDDLHGLCAQVLYPLGQSIPHAAWNRHLFAPMVEMWLVLPDSIVRQKFPT